MGPGRGTLILGVAFLLVRCTGHDSPSSSSGAPSGLSNPPECALGGFRDLTLTKLGSARVFDAQHPIVLRTNVAPQNLGLRLTLGGRAVPLTSTSSSTKKGELSYSVPPNALGTGELIVKTGTIALMRALVHFARSPHDHPDFARAARLYEAKDYSGAERALQPVKTSTDAWLSFWGYTKSGDAAFRSGDVRRAIELWTSAAEPPRANEETGRASKRLRAAAFLAMKAGEYDQAERLLQRSAALCEQLQDDEGRYRGTYYFALLRRYSGERLRAGRAFLEAIALAERAGAARDVQGFKGTYANYLAEIGRFVAAYQVLRSSPLVEGSRPGDRALRAWNLGGIRFAAAAHGVELRGTGDPWADYERALTLLKVHGTPQQQAGLLGEMAEQALAEGDVARAGRLLSSLPPLDATEHTEARWRIRFAKARYAVALGKAEEARELIFGVRAQLRAEFPDRVTDEVLAWTVLAGDWYRYTGDRRSAIDHYTQAIQIRRALDRALVMPSEQSAARWRLKTLPAKLAELLVKEGRVAQALAVLEADRADVVERLFQERLIERRPKVWRRYRKRRHEHGLLRKRGCARLVGTSKRKACEARIKRAGGLADAALELVYAKALDAPPRKERSGGALLTALRGALGADQAILYLARTPTHPIAIWLTPKLLKGFVGEPALRTIYAHASSSAHVFVVPSRSQDGDDVFVRGLAKGPPFAGLLSSSFVPYGAVLETDTTLRGSQAVVLADPDGTLHRASDEGDWVQRRLGALRVEVPEPDKRLVLSLWKEAAIFHFTGHAEEADGPWGTRLRLGRGDAITLEDLLAVRPRGGLAVLNGCATGRATAGSTLPSVLLRAGTRSVLATVRRQLDGESLAFVKRFYLAGGDKRPGRAFAAAVKESKAARDDAWKLFRLWGRP